MTDEPKATPTTDQPTLAVTQADREAAADWIGGVEGRWIRGDDPDYFLSSPDDHRLVQAFARHRTNSEPRSAVDLREAIEHVAKAIYDATHAGLSNCYAWDDEWEPHQEAQRERYYKEARAAIPAALATHSPAPMADWQDMDDAPKDGSQILAWFWSALVTGNSYGWADTIRWWNGMWWDDRDGPCEPVAWMARPAPPAAAHPSTQEG